MSLMCTLGGMADRHIFQVHKHHMQLLSELSVFFLRHP